MTTVPNASNSPGSAPNAESAHTSGVISDHPARLYTPTQAADLLALPESWLRRQAGQRRIPSTKLGKHLRFSHNDLARIAAGGEQPMRQPKTRSRRS